jgi:hypothetical protein
MGESLATWLTLIGFLRLAGQVSRKYFHNRSTKDRLFVEKPRSGLFDCLSQRKKLRHASAIFSTLHSGKLVHCSVADLTQDDLIVVQHGEPKGKSFRIVSLDLVTDQRHGTPHVLTIPAALGCMRVPLRSTISAPTFCVNLSRS